VDLVKAISIISLCRMISALKLSLIEELQLLNSQVLRRQDVPLPEFAVKI
jgi:hypothetical protein